MSQWSSAETSKGVSKQSKHLDITEPLSYHQLTLTLRIEKTFVGTCHPQYGYIILLLNKQNEERYWQIGDGFIQDTSGDVIFKVSFRAIACMPEAGEVLDAKVIEVSHSGIHVQSGPIRAFISMKVSKKCCQTHLTA